MLYINSTTDPVASERNDSRGSLTEFSRFLRTIGEFINTPRGGASLLIIATLGARLLFAGSMGLGVDESYMVAGSRSLDVGYFDHPPVAWWLVWLASHALGSESEIVVRLPFVTLFAVTTWLMYRLASELFDECAGLWSAALLNAAPVLGVTSGSWVLPDGPLLAALLGAALCFVRACSAAQPRALAWWLATGVCFGIALCSKYIAVPIGFGAVLFLCTDHEARQHLRRPGPWLAGLVALAFFSPVIWWNVEHDWVSFVFQGSRAVTHKFHAFGPLTNLLGEAIFFLPWIWFPLAFCVVAAIRRGRADRSSWFLLCLSLPTVVLFEIVSLRARVLFHWAAPGTMFALPLLGDLIGRHRRNSAALRRGISLTAATVVLGAALVASEVRYNWLPSFGESFAFGADPDLEAVDWDSFRVALARDNMIGSNTVVAALRWIDAGKADYALRGSAQVICLGQDPREYGIQHPLSAFKGRDILIVAPKISPASVTGQWASSFDSLETLPAVMLFHGGRPAMALPLYLGRNFHPR